MAEPKNWLPLGIRRGWSDWQKNLDALASWADANGIETIDLGEVTADDLAILQRHNLRLGSADLIAFPDLMSTDAARRKELIEQNVAYVKEAAALGAKVFFTCFLPGDATAKRSANYKLAVESFQPIAAAAHAVGASLAVEGYPGNPPHQAAIGCTPESVRRLIADIGPGFGLNYDPSHLVRLGVDHIRFLDEFLPFVRHVHAKDTDIDPERLYEFGHQQSTTFAANPGFGGPYWRYTVPGHGIVRWVAIFETLRDAGYGGAACIELEDVRFNGTEAGEKAGILHAMAYLRGVVGG